MLDVGGDRGRAPFAPAACMSRASGRVFLFFWIPLARAMLIGSGGSLRYPFLYGVLESFALPGPGGVLTRPVLPAALPKNLIFLKNKSMRNMRFFGRAARRWQALVVALRVRWFRFQCSVAGFYFRGVTLPFRFWLSCGRPVGFRPRYPWWQPFVWRWLCVSGWVRPSRPARSPGQFSPVRW